MPHRVTTEHTLDDVIYDGSNNIWSYGGIQLGDQPIPHTALQQIIVVQKGVSRKLAKRERPSINLSAMAADDSSEL